MTAREHRVAVEARLLVLLVRREDRLWRAGDDPRRILGVEEQRAHRVLAFGVDAVVELEPAFRDAKRYGARPGAHTVPHAGARQRERRVATPAHEIVRKCDPDSEHAIEGRGHGTGECHVTV